MPLPSMPALDANVCGDWTENQVGLYERLPYYLGQMQDEVKKVFPTWGKVINKKRKWEANKGDTLKVIRTNRSPYLRQQVRPKLLSSGQALTDVMDVRETEVNAMLFTHKFNSPIFNFYPSFSDFMDHIDDNGKDIMEKIEMFNDLFLRTMVYHMAPWIYVCKADGTAERINAPVYDGLSQITDATGKSAAFIGAQTAAATGHLQMTCVEQIMTEMENDLGIPFYKGSELPKEDAPLDGKYLLKLDSEAYNQFIHDPWVKDNKSIDMNYVNNNYRGLIMGRATTMFEFLPLTYTATGVQHEPELRNEDDGDYNFGDNEPNPDYVNPATSPWRVAWLCGKNQYEALQVGPPPGMFTGNKFPDAPSFQWNARPRLTKNFLIKCADADGAVNYEANTDGEYVKFTTRGVFGIVPGNRRNIIPILYKRKRGK